MAEHDYVIANQNGANTRSDLNNALAAIVSNNSKASAPTTTYAYMWWADTANDILKQRNGADSAWISILTLSTGAPLATIANFTSTGIDDNATSTAITIDSAEHVSLAHGIGFNGDTAAANALDDYEEGTWTPTLAGSTTNPSVSYGHQTGYYTKIGRMVHLTFNVYITGVASNGSGAVGLSGMPFSSSTLTNQRWAGSLSYNNIYAVTGTDLTPILNQSNSSVGFNYSNNNTNTSQTSQLTDTPSAGYIQGSIYYMTD